MKKNYFWQNFGFLTLSVFQSTYQNTDVIKDPINNLQLFIFTNVTRWSRLPLWVGYFIYFQFTHVIQYFINRYIFSSIKETNWIINKEMCVLLFNVFKHLLFKKTDVLKIFGKSKFLRNKIWRNARALNSERCKVYSGKRLFWHYYLQLTFVYNRISDFF